MFDTTICVVLRVLDMAPALGLRVGEGGRGGGSGRRTSRLLHCKVQMGNDADVVDVAAVQRP